MARTLFAPTKAFTAASLQWMGRSLFHKLTYLVILPSRLVMSASAFALPNSPRPGKGRSQHVLVRLPLRQRYTVMQMVNTAQHASS